MASNQFGTLFRITTFGESHGPGIGVVIDGCPSGIPLTEEVINQFLSLRKPGNSPRSLRKESDRATFFSGVWEGKTTGTPIAILINNEDSDPSYYEAIKELYRPGHANFTYLHKYGLFDYRGGGRASARETAARVAAGAIAHQLLEYFDCACVSFLSSLGSLSLPPIKFSSCSALRTQTHASPLFCPDPSLSNAMLDTLSSIQEEGDSLGGIISSFATIPPGLGDPIYQTLDAMLAHAMLSIPGVTGFEIGDGFAAAQTIGSQHNDLLALDPQGTPYLTTNHAGGTLGGISTGAPLFFRVACKPTSTIRKPQKTLTLNHQPALLAPPSTLRHDPCIALRAVPVVEAMTAIVLADALLMNRSARINPHEIGDIPCSTPLDIPSIR